MSVPVFGLFGLVCPYTSLDLVCFSLSPWICVIMIGYIITHMSVAWSVFFSLCLSLSVSITVFSYIVTDFSSRSTSLDRSICLSFLPFSLSVSAYGYIIGSSACIGTSLDSYFFLTFRLNVFTSVRIYYHSLQFLSDWISVLVLSYIVTDCTCTCTGVN